MKTYLCYDLKGIQSFIFKVPKLKYAIGGSAIIDIFDKEIKSFDSPKTEYVYSGGGKGTFICETEEKAEELKNDIKDRAHEKGLDICFGQDSDFFKAAKNADEFYSFMPKLNSGYACPVSGLYPVENKDEPHQVVKRRLIDRGDVMFRHFEDKMLKDVMIPGRKNEDLVFFRNVAADDPDDGIEGARALGNRNRWAVICMDGNDMGMQFRFQEEKKPEAEAIISWLKKMSSAIDEITGSSVRAGIQRVVSEWAGSDLNKENIADSDTVTLPVRPLIAGGDDIIILCHCSYAVTFVKEVVRNFNEISRKYSGLWEATGGELTISAGILFAPVTIPLHTAIPYAEALLAVAKGRGRKETVEGRPAPACIDWEQITDSVIDTPWKRRQENMFFFDEDIDRTIRLTKRPYTIEELEDVEKLAREYGNERKHGLPGTVRHKILPALSKSHAERTAFAAEIRKNHREFFRHISETEINSTESRWDIVDSGRTQSTDVIDALMLLEEDKRMEKETV